MLHDLEVKAADVFNVDMMKHNREKILTVLDQQFGDDVGKSAIIVRVLYSLKSASASFKAHLELCMLELGYESCYVDPDLWMKPE